MILPKTSYDLAVFSTFLIYWTFLIPISWILYWTIDFPANKFCAWMERLLGGDGKIVLEEEVGRGTSANLAYDSSRTMNGGYDSGRVSQRRGDADGESGTTLDEGVRRRKASPESLDVDAVEMEPLYGYGNGTLGRRGEGEGYGYGGWQATPVTATVTPVTSNTYAAVGADGSRVASPYTQTNTPYTQTQSATPYTQSTTPHPQSGNENGHAYQPPQPNPYPPAQTPTTPTITLTAEQYQAYLRLCQTDPEEAGRWYRSMEGYNVAISPV